MQEGERARDLFHELSGRLGRWRELYKKVQRKTMNLYLLILNIEQRIAMALMYNILFECLTGEAERYPIRQHKTVHYSPITVLLPNRQNTKLRDEAVRLFMHFVD